MSRVAKMPILFDSNVTVKITDNNVAVKGEKGEETYLIHRHVKVNCQDNVIKIEPKDTTTESNVQAGTARANINNLIIGVSKGFEKKLLLIGVGYRVQKQDKVLNLTLGYSHPVTFKIPDGIAIETPTQTEIVIKGTNKQAVGQTAANIRALRRPDPYKGKGVRYSDEVIVLKETKKK
jgi:large subunit ribosomal protein L6